MGREGVRRRACGAGTRRWLGQGGRDWVWWVCNLVRLVDAPFRSRATAFAVRLFVLRVGRELGCDEDRGDGCAARVFFWDPVDVRGGGVFAVAVFYGRAGAGGVAVDPAVVLVVADPDHDQCFHYVVRVALCEQRPGIGVEFGVDAAGVAWVFGGDGAGAVQPAAGGGDWGGCGGDGVAVWAEDRAGQA